MKTKLKLDDHFQLQFTDSTTDAVTTDIVTDRPVSIWKPPMLALTWRFTAGYK
jgi:hypothetical protein